MYVTGAITLTVVIICSVIFGMIYYIEKKIKKIECN